jgi:hypothetical protein
VAFQNLPGQSGTLDYTATISYGGTQLFSSGAIRHWQYQVWHKVLWHGAASMLHVAHNPADLTATESIHDYDASHGVGPGIFREPNDSNFSILGPGDHAQDMGRTGARNEIGPDPAWCAAWIMLQTEETQKYAVAQSDAAGSIPWFFYDISRQAYANATTHPKLWADNRGVGPGSITEYIEDSDRPDPNSEWKLNTPHMPDDHYVPALLTGDRWRFIMLEAQACFSTVYDGPMLRGDSGYGYSGNHRIFVTSGNEVRGAAWSLRTVCEAVWLCQWNPELRDLLSDNLDALLENAVMSKGTGPVWPHEWSEFRGQGELSYHFYGEFQFKDDNGIPAFAPWQMDYAFSTICRLVKYGNPKGRQLLEDVAGWEAGRFIAKPGWLPINGFAYYLISEDTWAGCQTVSAYYNQTSGTVPGWGGLEGYTDLAGNEFPPQASPDYVVMARAMLRFGAAYSTTNKQLYTDALAWVEANTAMVATSANFQKWPMWSWAKR